MENIFTLKNPSWELVENGTSKWSTCSGDYIILSLALIHHTLYRLEHPNLTEGQVFFTLEEAKERAKVHFKSVIEQDLVVVSDVFDTVCKAYRDRIQELEKQITLQELSNRLNRKYVLH